MDTDTCSARAHATQLNVMAERMQHCCSHLRTKERLDDAVVRLAVITPFYERAKVVLLD